MKKTITILAIFLSIGLYAQDWTTITSGTTEKLTKIHFINDITGFIIGENGTILRTTDGGTTWLPISSGNILASDYLIFSGEIFKSTDGGINWNSVGDPVLSALYTDAFFINSTTGYLTSWYAGHLVKTTDAGSSWTEITSIGPLVDDLYGVSFPSNNLGIVAASSGEILKTIDEAVTWTSIFPSSGSPYFMPRGLFTTSTQNYIVVGLNNQTTNNEKIYITTDGGTNWTLTNASTNDLNDVYCTSNNCYAV